MRYGREHETLLGNKGVPVRESVGYADENEKEEGVYGRRNRGKPSEDA